MELLLRYFPELTPQQTEQFASLQRVYSEWNERINVISRKDIDNLFERHILHSLSIARFIKFLPGSKIMDLGTGGGFPGIPLAILFPGSRFHLVDSIGKKLKVVEAVKEHIGLNHVFTFHARAEEMEYRYDFVVSRAVAPLPELLKWTKGKYATKSAHPIRNGLICLKGGDIADEIRGIKNVSTTPIHNYFPEPYFADKYVVYCAA